MESKNQGTVRRILSRVGEGLVIGIGAAIVLSGYEALNHATDELRKTRTVLEKQVEINQKLKDQIAIRDQKLARVQDLLVETDVLSDKVASLANRLREVETALAPDIENPLNTDKFDWSQFQALERTSFPNSVKWEKLIELQLESLQDAINAQRSVQ